MPHHCEAGSATEKGRRRNNQDAVRVEADLGYAIVADGMGGAAAGEVASRLAVEAVSELVTARLPRVRSEEEIAALLREAIDEANRRIYAAAEETPDLRGMGTTVVLVLVRDGRFWAVNVGDSRAYRLRDRDLRQLSREHSLVQTRVEAGLITPEEALHQPDRNVLTRAAGTNPAVEPEVVQGEVEAGDTFLLTSDGVHGVLSAEALLQSASGEAPQTAARRLVAEALAQGSNDNATAAVLRVLDDPVEPSPEDPESSLDSILQRPLVRPSKPRSSGSLPWTALA
ncbi:MAG: serine/threonine-protein phosphatase, partial [Proteobacteria bacterium]|nr:serine/threonine-protein phosphatase [Pseudomonadota bacterium]